MKTKNLKYLVGSLVLVSSLVLLGNDSVPGDEDGGNIKFIAPDQVTISSIFTEGLKRCRTAMDYIITGGYCYDFLDKIGYVTDFSIGYEIILYP
ncbi:MAG: hypothetical protein U9O50_03400, partial [Acidobacteriota bacterium]|nr:hypothetical protein [Acidobacteriota bacterium]